MESHLDFTGKATETRTRHRMNSSLPELTTQEFFTYAPQGQMISHTPAAQSLLTLRN